jgi:CoA:oxalate CoA-transferase
MPGPLAGIRVVEVGQEIQGPYAAQYLADMGADVVKIENRETGDLSRWLRADTFFPGVANGHVSPYFLAMNRGKRSLTLDLKSAEGKEILHRLIAKSDVLLTNYRPGVLDRLGFGWDELSKLHPRLVWAQGSSWGPEGPWKMRPSRDTLAQAAGGLMAKTGHEGEPPIACGAAVADTNAALALAASVLAGLFSRERTGKGQKVGASIYGTVIAMQAMELAFASYSGRDTRKAGRAHQLLHGVWGAFRTKDGWLCLAGVDDKRWPRFCKILGIEHLEKDPECDNVTRNFHGEGKIEKVLDETFAKKTTAEWLAALNEADILATKVEGYPDVLKSEQAKLNRYLTTVHHQEAGDVTVAGNPITMDGTPLEPTGTPPEHGQHTEEVLLELGYGWEEIAALREKGAV